MSNNWFSGTFSYQECTFFIFRFRFMIFGIKVCYQHRLKDISSWPLCDLWSLSHEGHNNMSHTAWWQSTLISKIINIYQKIKMLHSWYENVPKSQLFEHYFKGNPICKCTDIKKTKILAKVISPSVTFKKWGAQNRAQKIKMLHSWYENVPKSQLFDIKNKGHMEVMMIHPSLCAGSTHLYQIS
jgi:hypothetical protein